MSRNKIYALIGLLIIALSWTMNRVIQPMEKAKPFKVQVEKLPETIGEWSMGQQRTADPEIQKALQSATIVDREYTKEGFEPISLMLVSASNSVDIHNPQLCFPNQGWRLDDQSKIVYQGQEMNSMRASIQDRRYRILYWIQGGKITAEASNPWVRRLRAVRKRLVPEDEGQSLLARIIVPETREGRRSQTAFLDAFWAPLQKLVQEAQQSTQSASLPESSRSM